jgi:hypothetical protein
MTTLAEELNALAACGLSEDELRAARASVISKYSAGSSAVGGASASNSEDHKKALARLRWWSSLGPVQRYDALKSKSYTCVNMDQASLQKLFEQKDMMGELVDIVVRFKANYSPSTEMVSVDKGVVLDF